jgi:HD domain
MHPALLSRRQFTGLALSTLLTPGCLLADEAAAVFLPEEVAGIRIPRSLRAQQAALLSQRTCPDFLFNHCMRTYLFGALALQRQRMAFNPDLAFVAAALHDLGLLPKYESPSKSFEIDGADAAEKFGLTAGLAPHDADVIWHSIALHDVRFAITRRSGPEAMLVALGAGGDVDGPDLATEDERRELEEVVAAFPRLHFKQQFTDLLVAHCKRKPTSQRGTWLEGLCREQVPSAWGDTVESEVAAAPFAE